MAFTQFIDLVSMWNSKNVTLALRKPKNLSE